MVKRLDAIRLERSTLVEGKFDYRKAAEEYPKAFQEMGLEVEKAEPAALAARAKDSPIREQLVAALDDWALVAFVTKDESLQALLLQVARLADADGWRDRLRDPEAWKNQHSLEALAKEEVALGQSPQLLTILGQLLEMHRSDAVETLLRAAQQRHPADFWLNFNMGTVLAMRKADEAEAFLRAAVALRPQSSAVYSTLGLALYAKGRLDEAIDAHQTAIRLDPKHAKAHYNLGIALHGRGRQDEAMEAFQTAIRLDPKDAKADGALGHALLEQGRFTEARDATRRCLDLLAPKDPLRNTVTRQLARCERMIALDANLPALLKGDAQPKDAAEQLEVAQLCQLPGKRLYVAAARFYADAFAAEPKTAGTHRSNAARAAALAGCGQGKDDPLPDEQTRARLRQQALDWLRADLTRWTKHLDSGNSQDRAQVVQRLQTWQREPDLAGLRDEPALARLPEAEREAYRKLWANVDALLNRAQKESSR